MQHTIIFIKDW